MDIAKIKKSLPKIDIGALRNKCQKIRPLYNKILQKTDLKVLAISISAVAFMYLLLFVYISINAGSTIKKLENQLATEILPVKFVEKSIYNSKPKPSYVSKSRTIKGLHEETPLGRIPIIRTSDSLTSFRAYQPPFSFGKLEKPVISFIILDYGLSRENSEAALALLSSQVSFLLSPYAALPDEWLKMAQDKGHETWMSLPIQNERDTDLGKNTIFHHASINKKQKAMRQSLALAQGYVGVGSYTDDSMMVTKEDYLKLADEIYARGIGFIEINPDAPSLIKDRALTTFVPYIRADIEILKMRGEHNSFEALEKIAHKNGHAVAVIPNYPNTIKNLAAWMLKVAQSDYIVVPVSAIYDLPLYKAGKKSNELKNKNNDQY